MKAEVKAIIDKLPAEDQIVMLRTLSAPDLSVWERIGNNAGAVISPKDLDKQAIAEMIRASTAEHQHADVRIGIYLRRLQWEVVVNALLTPESK